MDPDDTLPIAFLPQDAHHCPGRLGFCPAPGLFSDYVLRPRDLVPTELACLRDRCGASVLVTLLEEDEMSEIGLDGLLASVRDAGLESVWFPIRDCTAPSNVVETGRLVSRILDQLTAGRTVVIHCAGGIGRSGTIAACCLVAAGQDPARAIELVREVRSGAATAPGQEKFVHEFAQVHRPG
jgi:hypothetical protein